MLIILKQLFNKIIVVYKGKMFKTFVSSIFSMLIIPKHLFI